MAIDWGRNVWACCNGWKVVIGPKSKKDTCMLLLERVSAIPSHIDSDTTADSCLLHPIHFLVLGFPHSPVWQAGVGVTPWAHVHSPRPYSQHQSVHHTYIHSQGHHTVPMEAVGRVPPAWSTLKAVVGESNPVTAPISASHQPTMWLQLQQTWPTKLGSADISRPGSGSGVANNCLHWYHCVRVGISHKCIQTITYVQVSFLLLGQMTTRHPLQHSHTFLPQSIAIFAGLHWWLLHLLFSALILRSREMISPKSSAVIWTGMCSTGY